jgi:hypothetical protein
MLSDLLLILALLLLVAGVFITFGLGPALFAAAVPIGLVGIALSDGAGLR